MAVGESPSSGQGQLVGGVEREGAGTVLVIYVDVALADRETAEDEAGDGLDDMAVDDALQLASAVFRAGAAFDEKSVGGWREDELKGCAT